MPATVVLFVHVAVVPHDRLDRAPSALTLDQVRRRFIQESLRYMPGAQAMPCELRRTSPAARANRFTAYGTKSALIRGPMFRWRSIERKTAPAVTLANCSHSRNAFTGQCDPPGKIQTVCPSPVWSVFDRGTVTRTRPSSSKYRCSTSIATISDRRNAPAKPIRSSARFRAQIAVIESTDGQPQSKIVEDLLTEWLKAKGKNV